MSVTLRRVEEGFEARLTELRAAGSRMELQQAHDNREMVNLLTGFVGQQQQQLMMMSQPQPQPQPLPPHPPPPPAPLPMCRVSHLRQPRVEAPLLPLLDRPPSPPPPNPRPPRPARPPRPLHRRRQSPSPQPPPSRLRSPQSAHRLSRSRLRTGADGEHGTEGGGDVDHEGTVNFCLRVSVTWLMLNAF